MTIHICAFIFNISVGSELLSSRNFNGLFNPGGYCLNCAVDSGQYLYHKHKLEQTYISSQISLEIDAVQMLSFQVSALMLCPKVEEGIQHGRIQVLYKTNRCHDCTIITLHVEVVYTSPFINAEITFICPRSK